MRQSTAHILTSRRACMASPILTGLTSDPELASLAAYYAHVFLACIPMRVLRSQVLQYFSAQKIVVAAQYAGVELDIVTDADAKAVKALSPKGKMPSVC